MRGLCALIACTKKHIVRMTCGNGCTRSYITYKHFGLFLEGLDYGGRKGKLLTADYLYCCRLSCGSQTADLTLT